MANSHFPKIPFDCFPEQKSTANRHFPMIPFDYSTVQKSMASRHFPKIPFDYFPEDSELEEEDLSPKPGTELPLELLLRMPYYRVAEKLLKAAMEIKEKIVVETWNRLHGIVENFSLLTGVLGTAFLLLKSFEVTNNQDDLRLSSEIIQACVPPAHRYRRVSFLLGSAGVYALGAVVANYMGDQSLLDYYLSLFREITPHHGNTDQLFSGRAGYLWACCFINKRIGGRTIPPDVICAVRDEIISNGRKLGTAECPLMFKFNRRMYWGAAHGWAGIMHVLMNVPLEPDQLDDVKGTLLYMVKTRWPAGNYPESEENKSTDVLVHWGNGAPGIALTLMRASEVFSDEAFLQEAMDAAEVVWERGPLKGVGLYDGTSGNAYVFGSLYRLTSMNEHLFRAKAFTCFLLERAHKLMHEGGGDMSVGISPYSLFEGLGGVAYLFLDMVQPSAAKFPAYEI